MKRLLVGLLSILIFTAVFVLPKQVFAVTSYSDYPSTPLNLLVKEMGESILGRYDKNGNLLTPGAVTTFGAAISTVINTPPASGRDYVSYLEQKFHVPGTPTPVYAADTVGGIGYNALSPILPFWTAMRNLAYFFFAIFFVVAGIMIMLRSKIDPKTAANIQNTLPKVVLSLLLVTFSYAIAGFIIDIMYVAIGLVITVASQIAVAPGSATDFQKNLATSVATQNLFGFILTPGQVVMYNAAGAVTQIVSNFLKSLLGEAGGSLGGLIAGSIATLIIGIAILWALFKIFFLLLMAYGQAILGIIFAPMQIMLDVIPGQNQFEGWVRNLLANLLVFPATIAMIFIAVSLSYSVTQANVTYGFVPPLIGGNSQQAMQALVGLALLLTTPKVLEILQDVLKAPPNKWGSAWGEAIGVGRQWVQGGATGLYTGARDSFLGETAEKARAQEKEWLSNKAQQKPQFNLRQKIAMKSGAKGGS